MGKVRVGEAGNKYLLGKDVLEIGQGFESFILVDVRVELIRQLWRVV